MATNIAVAGKGGTGKTTFTTLLTRYLIEKTKKSILAVDADPNANLNEVMGIDLETTVSEVLEETKNPKAIPNGMSKHVFMQYRLAQALVENDRVDLLAMGGPEGPGCYCFPNDVLRGHLHDLDKNYDYLITDNEAGLEHISRQIIKEIDHLFVISDNSARGIKAAKRVHELVNSLKNPVRNMYLVITKSDKETVDLLKDEISQTGLNLAGYIPVDDQITKFDISGEPIYNLPEDSTAVKSVYSILDSIELI